MKYLTLIILPILAICFSCQESDDITTPSDDIPPIETGLIKDNKIIINNTERDYDLFVPESYNNSPVVILLHGNGGSSEDITGESGNPAPYKKWLEIASDNNLILLIPNGIESTNGNQGWNDCRDDASGNPNLDDTSFIEDVLTELQNTYSIDNNKIYVNGTSNGGHMAIRLAQEIPEKITAIAVIVASMPENSACLDSDTPISALFMNGTDDPILPFEGGEIASNRGSVLSTDASINYWVERNETNTTPIVTMLTDIDSSDDSMVEKSLYQNGNNSTEVVLYKINNGGHTEPSMEERYSEIFKIIVGEQNGDIEMVNEVWSFFENKSK